MKLTKFGAIKNCISWGLVGLGLAFAGCGGGNETQTISPASTGKRGERCEARNDCASGLACINGICSRNDFPTITPEVNECVSIECEKTEDCCGDKPIEVPAKCNEAASVCYSQLASCTASTGFQNGYCTSSSQCGGGTCVISTVGSCTGGIEAGTSCSVDDDCADDTCNTVTGYCRYSTATACTVNTDCTYFATYGVGTCTLPTEGDCNCANADYDPSNPICTDPDCTGGVCEWECNAEKECVAKTDECEVNSDCDFLDTPVCVDARCVQCADDADCDEDEKCTDDNVCKPPCKFDEECGFLEECDEDSGQCKEVGCKTDIQCVYWFSVAGGSAQIDPREAKCVEVEGLKQKQCRIPCEVDAECGKQSICQEGTCTFIGCKSDAECRALHPEKQTPTDLQPWVTQWKCEKPAE